jgi:hypothetical protein
MEGSVQELFKVTHFLWSAYSLVNTLIISTPPDLQNVAKHYVSSNVAVEWLAILLRIQEFPSSNLSPETGYPDWDFSCSPQSLTEF